MFLSRLTLNARDQLARRDLARPYQMHRTLMNSYPYPRVENRCDLLFRVEPPRHGPPVVLVQTRDDPGEWPGLADGYLLRRPESKSLDLPITLGQRLRFRLRANPTKRVAAKNQRLGAVMVGKRVGLTTEADQLRWLLRKAERSGFGIPGEWVDARHPETSEPIQLPNFRVDAVPEGRDRNSKPGCAGAFVSVRFDGVLVVTDPALFKAAVANGIGSGKAFGFGLLSFARLSSSATLAQGGA
jgi:CRISPR system Cascade subunit CasE